MSGEHLPDSRESVDDELRYLYFDLAVEPFLQGKCALQVCVSRYMLMCAGVVDPNLDPWRLDPPERAA